MSSNAQDLACELQSDEFIFAQEDDVLSLSGTTAVNALGLNWKILIVDDDVEVHEVTKLALSDVTFEQRSLTFISATSAQTAKQMLAIHPDMAIIFLDVVMETENAGLELIQYVREELGNVLVRIILRTGQPGQAPEALVAANYGIDDYKTKTELTAEKLFITVVTALRAFSTLTQMRDISWGLKQELAQYQSLEAVMESRDHRDRAPIEPIQPAALPSRSPAEPAEKIDRLSQLVAAVTDDILRAPNAGTLYTMHMMTRMARMVLRITDEHSVKLGLSQSKLAVLMYLSHAPELCASPSALAKHCGISRAAMTGLLDGLEQEDYVERDNHPFDRRALMVKLTAKGQTFLDWIAPHDRSQVTPLIDTMDEVERQKFIELARQVLTLLEEPSPAPNS